MTGEAKMVATGGKAEVQAAEEQCYDRESELKAFDETMAGVKGLIDAGITKVPRIFFHPLDNLDGNPNLGSKQFIFPVIDLDGIDQNAEKRKEIVDKVREASETWGFFQLVNHGIPVGILEEMIQGVRRFHEQDTEIKKQWYSRDLTRRTTYYSNFNLYSAPVIWRDTLSCRMAPNYPPDSEGLPQACSEILIEYSKQVTKLGCLLLEILSEGLGLEAGRLKDMDCAGALTLVCHFYPACPEPELTIGTRKHTDYDFITVLLQDSLGGLQVLHENQWVDAPPTPGALVINIGDLLQLISNGKYKSVVHRAQANRVGPRISVASFFSTGSTAPKLYGPIKELLSEENPPKYQSTTVEYLDFFRTRGSRDASALLPS